MSGQSPPRSRRQAHPTTVGQIHNVQTRETSRSPSLRERPRVKQSSMPLSSSAAAQMYSNSNATQQSLQTLQSQQSSPPMSNPARRSPPPGQSHRMLPTPPHPNPQIDASDRRSASPGYVPPGVTTHYPRPMHNNPARVLEKYHEDWEVTDQLMEEIERADLQQVQVPSHAIPPPLPHMNSYPPPPSYGREETVSPPKDPLEKVRVTERASPKELDLASQRRQRDREQQTARESPKTRERQQVSTSPNSGTFTLQNHSHTPENRSSPYHTPHGSQGDYPQYIPHDPPTLTRRNTVSVAHQPDVRAQQAQQQPSVVSQSPPSAAMLARAPDRSLPVQEEAEDDVGLGSKNGGPSRDSWKNNEPHLDQQRVDSPQHADITADEAGGPRYDPAHPTLNGRDSGSGHRAVDEKAARMAAKDDMDDHRFVDHGAEEYTPRSPTANLPESMMESFPTPQAAVKMASRPRPRSGATDQLGLRGLEALIEQNGPPGAVRDPNSAPPPANDQNRQQQFSSHRKPVPEIGDQTQQQQSQQSQSQQHAAPSPQNYRYDPRDPRYNSRYYIPDDLHNYPDDASVYFQSYIQSPRPDAPIPPTPHSQTAAPSPSPLISGAYDNRNGRDVPPYSPIAPVGSPYPFPFNHVRRPTTFQHSANNNNLANGNGPGPANIDQAMLREQYAKQWQIFAQNNNWGAMSDSTFSPAPTPFQGAFSPWAHWHTQRMFGKVPGDAMSMQSSPSHEPVPLPKSHPVSLRKAQVNARGGSKLKREASSSSPPRKPPPRVESTQPRDTSPEPSSSGEETAGEEGYGTPSASHSMPFEERWPTVVMPIGEEDDDESDWVDEDEELDQEDLLELEYHPTYVRTLEKRRRRWEIGWEALTHAFQNLDRQTDTTMVLVASPQDSSKLHVINSRSIRRTSTLCHSPAMRRLKAAFRGVAHHRRQTRTRKMPIIDHILTQTNSIGDGSDGSSESREGDLRRVLGTALNSLDALKNMYEQREARWNEEMARMYKEREQVEFFLRQLYGDRQGMNGTNGVLSLQVP